MGINALAWGEINGPQAVTHGGLIMFGTEWGYGGYGQFHLIVWIILAIALAVGLVWRLRSGSS